ncbi:MAG: glycoside hydrolase family 95 protein [Sphingomicrobium sp.]
MTQDSARNISALNRRAFMAGASLTFGWASLTRAQSRGPSRADGYRHELWYTKPAGPWVEALPVGNGRLGAMTFGRVVQERIQLNEDTLYAGSPYSPDNPDALAALPRVRALIDAGQFEEAGKLVDRSMMAKPLRQMPYGSAGDLFLDFIGVNGAADYRRSLDLDEAIVRSSFRDGKARFDRETFATTVDRVIVVRLTAKAGGRLDFDLGYRHPGKAKYGDPTYDGQAKAVAAAGAAWNHKEDLNKAVRPDWLRIAADGSDAMLVRGRNEAAEGIPAGLEYAVRVKVLGDGVTRFAGDTLSVRGARNVTLLISIATSYVNYSDVGGDPVAAVHKATEAAARKSFAKLKADHLAAHQAMFRRMAIRIDGASNLVAPTDVRIASVPKASDAALAALYVQYARYLMMSSSRGDSQPANLQGRWNEGTNPPWGSKYTININTEMNYWISHPANIAETAEPLVRMVEDLSVTGAKTARAMYGARGWMAHHNTEVWRPTAPIDGQQWGMWPTGGAWLCKTLWDHYEYDPDQAFLRRIYPLLRGASLFFLDTLVEDPKGRGLVTSPSISPENMHRPGAALASGVAMDRQILRDLFAYTLEAHGKLGSPDREFARQLETARNRLPADKIGAQGQLQEWLEDWDAQAPEQNHRHVSHLYAVYPSEQLNVRDTPAFIAAAKKSLDTRGDLSTGWATAWRIALWARMGDGERAYSVLQGLLGPQRTYPNMFDSHPPFQIDGNFGGAAGILEMLVQSWGGEIHILPALPNDWASGSIRGVRARGGIEVDLDWAGGAARKLVLRGRPRAQVKLRYRGQLRPVTLDSRGHSDVALS